MSLNVAGLLRNSLLVLTLSLCASPLFALEADPEIDSTTLDKVTGYAGIKFGSPYEQQKDSLTLEQDRGSLKIYRPKNPTLLLGPAILETVLYYYFDGKFYGVAMHTNDGQDSMMLESILKKAFGKGGQGNPSQPSFVWLGKKNGALFDVNTSTGDSSAFIFDRELHDAYLSYEAKSIDAASKQLIQ